MQNLSPIKARIVDYLNKIGVTKYQFYKDSGVTRGVLEKESGISEDNIAKFIAYAPDVNLDWLITGKGSHYYDKHKSSLSEVREVNETYKLRTDHNIEKQQVPLYNLKATTGLLKLFQNQGDVVPLDHIHIPNLPKCDGAIYVHGDSMVPLLKSGDIILYKIVHNISDGIFWGEMYLVSVNFNDDEWITVKWIQKSEKGKNYVKLVSENQQHEFKDVLIKNIRALALIKASIRINTMR